MSQDERVELKPELPSVFVAAHELKAPLVLMRQLALELQSTGGNTETIERLLLTVERSLRLVEQLTKTSRLEDSIFESEPLLARAICQTVANELTPFAKASGQKIVTRVSRRSGVAVGHRSLLTALLVNLCDNAITHNQAGGQVVLSAVSTKRGVSFAVRDYGSRLSRSAFDAMRLNMGKQALAMKDQPRSSGLGLWIASRFATAMGGSLTMTRHHKSGITVSLFLPHSEQLSLL